MAADNLPLKSPGIRFAIPPAIFLLCVAVAAGVHWGLYQSITPRLFLPIHWQISLGLLVGLAGFAFMMSAWFHFLFIGTTVTTNMPVNQLVENGSFHYSRNPMYVGFVSLLLSGALALGSLSFLISAGIMFFYLDRYVIPREEQYMSHAFEAPYLLYRNKVRRWL